VRIADLGGTTLGLAAGRTIWLDDNAAGWGWFVDATPRSDSEYRMSGDQGEQRHMDLLTAIAHELGHLLGHDHVMDGVMSDTLHTGTRSMPALGENNRGRAIQTIQTGTSAEREGRTRQAQHV
jgi:hypothetical protein